jgi:hypothetical protein
MLMYPPSHRLFWRKFGQLDWHTGHFQHIYSHRVLSFVIAPNCQPVKFDDKVQLARENTKQFFGISMCADSLRDAEERLITTCGQCVRAGCG